MLEDRPSLGTYLERIEVWVLFNKHFVVLRGPQLMQYKQDTRGYWVHS